MAVISQKKYKHQKKERNYSKEEFEQDQDAHAEASELANEILKELTAYLQQMQS
jgi:hypothetical protein